MFTVLVDKVFPLLGEFFGKLVAISNLSVGDFIAQFNMFIDPIYYTNYFTGNTEMFTIVANNGNGALLAGVLRPLLGFLFIGVSHDLQLWLAFLISFVEVYLAVSMIKFIKGVIR